MLVVRVVHTTINQGLEGVGHDGGSRDDHKGVHAPATTLELRVGVPVEPTSHKNLHGQPADTCDQGLDREHAMAPYTCMPKFLAGADHGAPLRHEDRY